MNYAKVLIVGSGPAGYTAATYAARALLDPVLIAGRDSGGQLTTTTDVENYPGFAQPVQGPWLMEQMKLQAHGVGTTIVQEAVSSIDLGYTPFRVTLDSGTEWEAEALIIATGARARWLGLAAEEAFRGHGISACATCDGFFFRKKNVIVVGGGNTAVEEALFLSNIASKVTVVHRCSELRAERVLIERLSRKSNVETLFDTTLEDVFGGTKQSTSISAVRLRNNVTETSWEVAADGVFVAIGHEPATELVKNQLELRPSGYIWTASGSTATSIPGVFAAGDVADEVFRQAVTAAGMGCMAAIEAARYLSSRRTLM